ncbi:MAG: hypothetical protein HC904_07930 [Blastochloris sp.]|nr:hypothetical protein [Blastochloris sp.]
MKHKNSLRVFLLHFSLAATMLLDLQYAAAQSSADEIMQKEVIRRNELLLRANKAMSEAEALIQLGKDEEARKKIDETLATVPPSGDGKAVYERASGIRSILEARAAERRFAAKDYFGARESALKALEFSSGNKAAATVLDKSNKALGIPAGSDRPSNPSVDPKLSPT